MQDVWACVRVYVTIDSGVNDVAMDCVKRDMHFTVLRLHSVLQGSFNSYIVTVSDWESTGDTRSPKLGIVPSGLGFPPRVLSEQHFPTWPTYFAPSTPTQSQSCRDSALSLSVGRRCTPVRKTCHTHDANIAQMPSSASRVSLLLIPVVQCPF